MKFPALSKDVRLRDTNVCSILADEWPEARTKWPVIREAGGLNALPDSIVIVFLIWKMIVAESEHGW